MIFDTPSMLLRITFIVAILYQGSRHQKENAVSAKQVTCVHNTLRFENMSLNVLNWSREGPSDVLNCIRSLSPYRGKRASWEQNGYIRSENQRESVCKENMQELWNLNPVSAQRPILTGKLVLLFPGVTQCIKSMWVLMKAEIWSNSNMYRGKWQASYSYEITSGGQHGLLVMCMCIWRKTAIGIFLDWKASEDVVYILLHMLDRSQDKKRDQIPPLSCFRQHHWKQ